MFRQTGMTSKEFGEALAFDVIDPCGEYRHELRHGQLMHLLDRANFQRDKQLLPVDFMNFTDKPQSEDPTPDEVANSIHAFFGTHANE